MKYDFEIVGDIGYGFGSKAYVAAKLKELKGKAVNVRMNSLGGNVGDALDIVARFQEHGNVTIHMKGMNASAATVIAMGAKKICMDKNGVMLIHNCLNVVLELGWMNANEIQEAIERLKTQAEDQAVIDRVIASVYSNRTGKTFDEIKEVMDRGGWLTSEDCLKLGLVDEICDETKGEAKAQFAARANFAELQMAYNLPDLPAMTLEQKLTNTLIKTEESMRKFFDSVLAWFGIEAMAEVTDEQMDGVLAQVEQKHNEMKGALDTANATIAERDQTIAEQVQTIEAHVATITERDATIAQNATVIAEHEATIAGHVATIAERDATIAQLNEQITALQAAPGADGNEPASAIAEEELIGVSNAQKMYDQIAGLI